MSKNRLLIGLLVCVWLAGVARADTFKLTDGSEVSGELMTTTANDSGVQLKTGDSTFQMVPWTSFSQDDLKRLVQTPKLAPFVEPFIEQNTAPRAREPIVKLQPPPRLARAEAHSLLGAMLSSGLGFLTLLLMYAANIYAAYEVALFRAQPVGLVCGVSAVAPIVGPIIFLSMATKMPPSEPAVEVAPEEGAEAVGAPAVAAADGAGLAADADNPMQAAGVAHPTGLKLAHEEHAQPKHPPATTYQRGQFTFNRRFIETKFAGFFGVVRREAEKDMVLVIKSARGEYIGQRISRIAANDLHLEVHRGAASEEVMIPFLEIQRIVVRHKDAD